MTDKVTEARLPDSEKITLNLGPIDLGRIDLLVRDGFYGNRADLMRTAIRSLLDRHEATLARSMARGGLELGLRRIGRAELEAARGAPLHVRVLGLASIAADVTPDLARAAIASLEVLGTLQASTAVKAALRDRIR